MDDDGRLTLSVNAGSSSLKISLFENIELVLTCSVSSISAPPAAVSFSASECSIKDQRADSVKDHESAFAVFLDLLKRHASIDKQRISHVCHRVVHGGDYTDPVIISNQSYHHIEELSNLAPLHNGAALSVISACLSLLPSAKSIAFFDTTFHRSIPPHISTYPIDPAIAKEKRLKKYGFHGLSYAFVLHTVARFLRKPPTSLNLIILHLGSGASACAIQNGLSLDTSMGLTPLAGLPGATRSGSVDPCLIFHYTDNATRTEGSADKAQGLHVTHAEEILNKHAGWKALTGTTDFKLITANAKSDDPNARLALDLFADRVLNYVGAYHLKLRGEVDALVFAGGIGERSVELRERVGRAVQCLGYVAVQDDLNASVDGQEGPVLDLGNASDARPGHRGKRVLVCRTDEQLEMARECVSMKF